MNYFETDTAAERYARGRPFIHARPIAMFKELANMKEPFKRCLDVACGTGQSSVAVAEICDEVIGIDISDGMLAQAAKHPKVTYKISSAENMPFDNNSFDLITVGLAMHWFDQPKFLNEAHRVLKANSWLVIYHNLFNRGARDLPAFKKWYDNDYLKRYAQPPRKNKAEFNTELAAGLFDVVGKDDFVNELPLTQEQLLAYIVSQSNVIAAVEQGHEKIEDVISWLTESTDKFFKENNQPIFLFDGKIWYFRKPAN